MYIFSSIYTRGYVLIPSFSVEIDNLVDTGNNASPGASTAGSSSNNSAAIGIGATGLLLFVVAAAIFAVKFKKSRSLNNSGATVTQSAMANDMNPAEHHTEQPHWTKPSKPLPAIPGSL